MLWKNLIEALIATAISYMAFPLIRLLINGGRFDRKSANRIALWNSVIVGVIFFVITAETLPTGRTWNAAPAFLYYAINKWILTDKD